ncbi:MAG: MBL fold metallo-hydrolase [Candidatus Omnitrophota bacterium]
MNLSKNNLLVEVKKYIVGPLETNCYLLWEKASLKGVLVDPGAYVIEIVKDIKDRGINVICAVNTHGHADHIAGNASFGFPVFIHELDAGCLGDSSQNLSYLSGMNIPFSKPAKLLKENDCIDLGNVKIGIIHTPGHTPGSISLKCENKVFTGDALFFESIGRTDIPGGNHEALLSSIREKLLSLPDDTIVFPGHGPETSIIHEKRDNPFVKVL